MAESVLGVQVLKGLRLADPFMVASSHWTANENGFRRFASYAPSSVTLKTTSRTGGNGKDGKRDMRPVLDHSGESFATYTDGPRTLELWDLATTSALVNRAREIFPPSTLLGLSVLQGAKEDYQQLATAIDPSLIAYVELNWKYSFRDLNRETAQARSAEISADLDRFFAAFQSHPRLVKLSREFLQFAESDEPFFWEILQKIAEAPAAIIVANSLRTRIPPSRLQSTTSELVNGVVVGEHLFLSTYNAIRKLSLARSSHTIPPIVAAGGIFDLGAVIDVMAAGAEAVQLCSVFDAASPGVLGELRSQLESLCTEYGDFDALLTAVRQSESEWAKVANAAAAESRTQHRIVTRALENTDAVLAAVRDTLAEEATGPAPDPAILKGAVPDGLDEVNIVVPRGNVLAYLLASRAAGHLRMRAVSLESSVHLRRQIETGTLNYDFTILTRSAYDCLLLGLSRDLAGRIPHEVGVVGHSRVEIVGILPDLMAVTSVFHFDGATGRRAFEQFVRARNKSVANEVIDNSQVLATLRYFGEHEAILAKPPLTRLYKLLVPQHIAERWRVIWDWTEDLLLVGRGDLLDTDVGKRIGAHLLATMQSEALRIKKQPAEAARACMDGIYWSYFASLLGARIRW